MKIKQCLFLFFLTISMRTFATQLSLGLTSENMYAWSVWENDKGVLKHYLYVYNKSKKEVKLQIKLKKYKPDLSDEVKVDKEIYKTILAPSRVTKLDYPANTDKTSFMNFFEDGKSVGMLPFNMEEPLRSFVDNKYKYYSNDVIHRVKAGLWMRFVSVYDPLTEMSISTNLKNPNEVVFVKIVNPKTEDEKKYQVKLDSLQQTDKTILKLDAATPLQTFKLQGDFGPNKFVFFPMYVQSVQNGKQVAEVNSKLAIVKE